MKLLWAILPLALAVACGKKGGKSHHPETDENLSFFESPNSVFPYRSTTPHKEELQKCIFGIEQATSCRVEELPLLGLASRPITVNDILDRTMVSHTYLGDSFRDVLTVLDPNVYRMFSGVAAIVISDRINPSFFNADTATIYLSARYFWRNAAERPATGPVDPRVAFSQSIFRFLLDSEYIVDGQYAFFSPTTNRPPAVMKRYVARILFHELAHANDFYPPATLVGGDYPRHKTYYQLTDVVLSSRGRLSDHLPTQPRSELMKQVEMARQTGEAADGLAESATAQAVVSEFRDDVVTDTYGYYSSLEDGAMLVEEALMYHYFGATRVVAVIRLTPTGQVDHPNPDALYWAQAGRIFKSDIAPRAGHLLEKIFDARFSEQVTGRMVHKRPRTFPEGVTWEQIRQAEL